MIWEKNLPRLSEEKTKPLSSIVGSLSTMPVKKTGLGLLNPVKSAKEKYLSLQRTGVGIIRAVTEGGALSNADCLLTLREEICDG